MMDEHAAFSYLSSRRGVLYREINAFRANLEAEIKKTQDRLESLPVAASIEASRLISLYNKVLKQLEEF